MLNTASAGIRSRSPATWMVKGFSVLEGVGEAAELGDELGSGSTCARGRGRGLRDMGAWWCAGWGVSGLGDAFIAQRLDRAIQPA